MCSRVSWFTGWKKNKREWGVGKERPEGGSEGGRGEEGRDGGRERRRK